MTKKDLYGLAWFRYQRLAGSPKNWKCPGVVRKLKRKIRNLEKAEG